MIKTERLKTTITCGTSKKANLSIGNEFRKLSIQELATRKKIGDTLEGADIKELPVVDIKFQDIQSIDIMIKQLQKIKDGFYPHGTLALAC